MGSIDKPFRILTLDGGGSLGVYTLGVLAEIEGILDAPLHESFDLVFGTSTGSIIASLIALGETTEAITEQYLNTIPDVMGRWRASRKSKRLHYHGDIIYGDKKFGAFKTGVGIVTTDLEKNRPMVFKSDAAQAHGMRSTFKAGFDCKIADAVIASSAAYPIFEKKSLETSAGPKVLVDGGFSANNPALLALTDAIGPLQVKPGNIRLLSIGTGSYPQKSSILQRISIISTITTLLGTNAATVDGLRKLLFPNVQTLRLNDSFTTENLRTNFVEANIPLLRRIHQCGRDSFGNKEKELRELLS